MVEINLMPWREYRRRQQWKNNCMLYGVITILIVMIVLSIHLYFRKQIKQARLHQPFTIVKENNLDIDIEWKSKLRQQRIIHAIFNCLLYGNVKIIIHDFSCKENNIVIKGYSSTADEINHFMHELLGIKYMDFVRLISLTHMQQRIEFELLAAGQ